MQHTRCDIHSIRHGYRDGEYRRRDSVLRMARTGNVIEYRGWMVSSNWRGGWHRIVNPVNNQIRTVPDILIFEINGLSIYL